MRMVELVTELKVLCNTSAHVQLDTMEITVKVGMNIIIGLFELSRTDHRFLGNSFEKILLP